MVSMIDIPFRFSVLKMVRVSNPQRHPCTQTLIKNPLSSFPPRKWSDSAEPIQKCILTVHCNSDCLCWSITIIIEWNASVDHWFIPFIDWGCVNCQITTNSGVKQTILPFVESILRRWVGLWTAGEVEACIHSNSVVSQIRCNKICIYGTIVCKR